MTSVPRPFDLLPTLLEGLGVTLMVLPGAALLALLIALLVGLCRRAPTRWLSVPAAAYIEVFRGTSALVQLFWFYYVLPYFGMQLSALPTAIVVLGLNHGAYGAEIVRGAVASIPRGQWEAAVALNMTSFQRMRYVILPQAVLRMLPPIGNLQIELLKNTALVYFISLHDLTYQGKLLQTATQRTAEIFGLTLLIYFLLALAITGSFRLLEAWLSRGRQMGGA